MTEHIDDIAIIGVGCRFPGDARSPEAFFDLLLQGRSAWSEVPKDRFNVDAYYHPSYERQGSVVARGGYFLQDDVKRWDAPFFNMTAAEANAMDPQQRLLLEVAYESMENAGLPIEKMAGSDTSVFVGVFGHDFDDLSLRDLNDKLLYLATGGGTTMLSNRLSWFYDLRGPSVTLDTACSSSLVALHLACQAIRSSMSDSRTSLVGGTGLMLLPDLMSSMSAMHFLSPDSKCFTFDERANGYARGEGVGILVLKHIDDAIRDGDTIRAVIRGTGVNQDGKTPGITLPNSEAQASLIRSTYAAAGLDMRDTGYAELHGTGTAAGDPLEMGAIAATFSATMTDKSCPLYVGSVKPNIGHLEGCAGVAGVLKALLILESAMIPPNINLVTPNPRLRFEEWNIKVPLKPTPWPKSGLRRASVNSFGYGGTNSHAILDDAFHYLQSRGLVGNHNSVAGSPKLSPGSDSDDSSFVLVADNGDTSPADYFPEAKPVKQQQLFVFSAPEESALKRLLSRYTEFLDDKMKKNEVAAEKFIENLAYTFGTRRSLFQWRMATTASSIQDLIQAWSVAKPGRANKPPRVVLVFTGQGAQWYAMGRELLVHEVFSRSVHEADAYLTSIGADWSVLAELSTSEDKSNVHMAKYSQPLCAILQIGLVDLLRHWNVEAKAVVGHSSGEIAAAYAIGALSAQDCWLIAYYRGIVSHSLKQVCPSLRGGMMSVGLSKDELLSYVQKLDQNQAVVVACVNSPSNVTLSGDYEALSKLEQVFKDEKIFARMLKVENAYHSPHMAHVAQDYLESIRDIQPIANTTELKMFSTVTGSQISSTELGPAYWVQNMTSPVEFVKALDQIFETASGERRKRRTALAINTVVEIGPHAALQGPIKQFLTVQKKLEETTYLSVLQRGQNANTTALDALGKLWMKGSKVDIQRANSILAEPKLLKSLVELPSYPFNHTNSYWHESSQSKNHRFRKYPRHDLVGAPVEDFNVHEPLWKNNLRMSELPWVLDHKIQKDVIYPGAGMICAAIEAARQLIDPNKTWDGFELRDISIHRALGIPASDPGVETFMHFKPRKLGLKGSAAPCYEFTFYSLESGGVHAEHASGLLQIKYVTGTTEIDEGRELAAELDTFRGHHASALERCTEKVETQVHYTTCRNFGVNYGPTFQGLTDINRVSGEACWTVTIPDTKAVMPSQYEHDHLLHPATLDACIQTIVPAFPEKEDISAQAMIPTSIDLIEISAHLPRGAGSEIRGVTQVAVRGFREIVATMTMSDSAWDKPVIKMSGLVCTGIGAQAGQPGTQDKVATVLDKVCSISIWKEDVDLVSASLVQEVVGHDEKSNSLTTRKDSSTNASNSKVLGTIQSWFDLKGHKQPDMKILEINSGTGNSGLAILQTLGGDNGATPRFGSYTLTDETSNQFEEAQKMLKSWSTYLDFKTLDIAQTLPEEGFQHKSFDVILVSHVQKLQNMKLVLENCHTLLKPGGKLIFGEFAPQNEDATSAEEQLSRLNEKDWKDVLRDAKFDDLQYSAADLSTAEVQHEFMMVATKPHQYNLLSDKITLVKATNCSEIVSNIASAVSNQLSDMGVNIEQMDLHSAAASDQTGKSYVSGHCIISLLEMEAPLLTDINEVDFEDLKKIIIESARLLWVTCGSPKDEPGHPGLRVISGLMRALRSEESGLSLHELHLSRSLSENSTDTAYAISNVFKSIVQADDGYADSEVVERNGKLCIPRYVPEENVNKSLQNIGSTPVPELQPLVQPGRPLIVKVGSPGMLDSLHFVDDPTPFEPLPDDYVEIEVRANGMNFVDIMIAMGQVPSPLLGVDVAGVISRVGSKVTLLQPGDRVAFCQFGAMCSYMRTHETWPQKLPDDMSLEEGATVPIVYMTAYQSLIEIARLAKGETLLIHGAAGGLGQALIQLAKHIGAEIYVTVGTIAKRELMMSLGIPSDHIFSSRDLTFAKGVMRMTGGIGIDVAVNSLAGEGLRKTWECMAPYGRFIEVGKKDILSNSGLEMSHFLKNVSFACVNIEDTIWHHQTKGKALLRECFSLFRQNILSPIQPLTIYDYTDMETAFRTMQQGKHVGKLVLKTTPTSLVPVIPRNPHPLALDPRSTYLLVGGLGGLGRAQALFLADHGAKYIAFISRSGDAKLEAQQTLQQLRERSIRAISYACDVSDSTALAAVLTQMAKDLPKIKGVIQGAMVLADGIFRNMPYSAWVAATRPKIQGTWNLHAQLPRDLDFFVMLSSSAAIIGNIGQSNYAAGNTFLDALAQFRRKQGLVATTLNLGIIRDLGYLDANRDVLEAIKRMEYVMINAAQFYVVLGCALAGYSYGEHEMPAQVMMGGGSGGINAASMAAGIELEYWWLRAHSPFAYLRQLDASTTTSTAASSDTITALLATLPTAPTLAAATETITALIVSKLAKAMMIPPGDIDVSRPVHTYGVDSLVAVEMRNWVVGTLRGGVSVFDILSEVPLGELAGRIAGGSRLVGVKVREGEGEASVLTDPKLAMPHNSPFICPCNDLLFAIA